MERERGREREGGGGRERERGDGEGGIHVHVYTFFCCLMNIGGSHIDTIISVSVRTVCMKPLSFLLLFFYILGRRTLHLAGGGRSQDSPTPQYETLVYTCR